MSPKVNNGSTTFRLWAPSEDQVMLRLVGDSRPIDHIMETEMGGYHSLTLPCGHGQRYQYIVQGQALPDPASAFQPEGVHGPSMVVDFTAFNEHDDKWSGVTADNLIIYELHVGTFTNEGTYDAAIERLDDLAALGVTAVELMPLAECPGRWNWGYDGVYLYAPSHNYGTPEALHAFVRACHERQLAVILDVVYNHLGPEGNYLRQFGPYFGGASTPWGEGLAISGKSQRPVRDFFIENALHWIKHYQMDGLRLDAVAAIRDVEPIHLVNEIGQQLRDYSECLNRPLHVIGETNLYRPEYLPQQQGSLHALLVDDTAHALGSCVGLPTTSRSRTYRGIPDVCKVLRQGYLYRQRDKQPVYRAHSAEPAKLETMVNCLQNHDIVGNSPHGKRVHHWSNVKIQQAAIALVILHPSIPLLFMGEEFSAKTPFVFFVDFSNPQLNKNVEKGRMREFRHMNLQDTFSPIHPDAFLRSKLAKTQSGNQETLEWYKTLIKIRKQWRQDGFLHTENLTVIKEGGKRIKLLYTKKKHLRFVAVDLSGRNPARFDLDTEATQNISNL